MCRTEYSFIFHRMETLEIPELCRTLCMLFAYILFDDILDEFMLDVLSHAGLIILTIYQITQYIK